MYSNVVTAIDKILRSYYISTGPIDIPDFPWSIKSFASQFESFQESWINKVVSGS